METKELPIVDAATKKQLCAEVTPAEHKAAHAHTKRIGLRLSHWIRLAVLERIHKEQNMLDFDQESETANG